MQITLEYLAGLIDGEGHIGFNMNIQGKYKYLRPCLEINMTYQPIIEMLHTQFGGHYSNHKEARLNRKPQYRWRVVNKQALDIIKLVYPYLIVKKSQAATAIAFSDYNTSADQELNEVFKMLMHQLNKRGN